MMRYLLDTNIISEPARPDPSETVVRRLADHSGVTALPSVAWHELVYGVRRMEEGRRRSHLRDYLMEVVRPSQPIVPYDADAAQWHGRARAVLEAEGRPPPFADGQIAAIAATRALILVTQNTSDFVPFEDLGTEIGKRLHVENWFAA
jgi:tRNA(fMet)-specific endonuclease VapC